MTHSDNMEQRYIPLAFTAGATSLTATAPANANVAPPGLYMLFLVDANGVPSVARMVSVQRAARRPTVTLTQPANGATFTAPATVSLAATASDADGTVAKVEFFNGATKLGEDTTAPYSFTWTGVAAGTYTVTARATDDLGASTTSAPSTITVSAANTRADREHHLTGRRRDLRLEADDHDHGDGERSGRQRRRGSSSATARRCSARTRARRTPTRGGTSRPAATS